MYLLEVIITNASLAIDRSFYYYSEQAVDIYTRVEIYFKRKINIALCISCKEISDSDLKKIEIEQGFEILKINGIIDEEAILSADLFKLAKWLSYVTISPLVSCLNVMLPKYLKTSLTYRKPVYEEKILIKNYLNLKLTAKQIDFIDSCYSGMPAKDARKKSISIFNKLKDLKVIEIYKEEKKINSSELFIHNDLFLKLNNDQERIYNQFNISDKNIFYLYGITGAGKTEVYLHWSRDVLKAGRQVLILVPEIALTPQMIKRVKERFSSVAFYHSELSDQERYEQYQLVKNQEVNIVVGTRSAIFLPFNNLGLIIIDEEHDNSYYQDNIPCYDARMIAMQRAKNQNAKLIYASATPSLEYYALALNGTFELLKLEHRINDSLPNIQIIDLNYEIKKNHSFIITYKLQKAIEERLSRHEQTILLLNRRGYAPVVKCGDCGISLQCSDCDIALSYHRDEDVLKCHQCGRIYKMPAICPHCHSTNLLFYGFGTKRVEEICHALFQDANIARLDRDAVNKKGEHIRIFEKFANKEIDILIGTQMIAKGLDFPDVTLVGILNADAGLMHQDYNSAKMTFDLLMQASGRSGRSSAKGEVYIQVFNNDHYVVQAVVKQDYEAFYRQEMQYRLLGNYPPYRRLIALIFACDDENRLLKAVDDFLSLQGEINFKQFRPMQLKRIAKKERIRILYSGENLKEMLDVLNPLVRNFMLTNNIQIKAQINPPVLE